MPKGDYLVVTVQRPWNTPWCGNRCYVDLLYPGVTEKFLEVTHEAYRRAVGDQFGKRIPGSFTDEPNLHPAPNGALPWTDGLPEEFQKRWGYSLVDNLAEHVPAGGRLEARAARLLPSWCSNSSSNTGASPTTITAKSMGWSGRAITWTTSGPIACPAPTTWRCTPGISGRPSTA